MRSSGAKGAGIKDLGALDGYPLSQALGINEKRQIVGTSCTADFTICRAVLWEHGRMIDLNDLALGHADQLYSANDINDGGQIAGQAVTPGTEQFSAVWAVPVERRHGHHDETARSAAPASGRSADAAPLPAAVRQALLRQFGLADATHSR